MKIININNVYKKNIIKKNNKNSKINKKKSIYDILKINIIKRKRIYKLDKIKKRINKYWAIEKRKKKMGIKIVLDTETNGIPKKNRETGLFDYKNTEDFENARLLSISYLVLNNDDAILEKKTIYINPDFELCNKAQKIHGLTKTFLKEAGISIEYLIDNLKDVFNKYNIDIIIAHNIEFDLNIILSEIYRMNNNDNFIDILNNKELYCTMKKFYKKLNYYKWPKLSEAYKYFYNKEIINAHDAEYDTFHCYQVYLKLIQL
jgi:DNA polymerase-3 subunit epsilon